jgi:predicted metal-dependent hydrolase
MRSPPESSRPGRNDRCLDIAGERVDYRLHRHPRCRAIGLSVGQQGLRVSAPLHVSMRDIEAVIAQHGAWVLEKLAHWKNHPATLPLGEGSQIPWLGNPMTLSLSPGLTRSRWCEEERKIYLAVPAGKNVPSVLLQTLKPRARAVLRARLAHYATQLGVPEPPLILSSARSRWGSCNQKGEIRLSWRLLHFDLALVDYVVAHELAHLKEMNHSARFWAIVSELYPKWRWARAEIKRLAPALPQF